jgi:nicotinamidase/pyrazinamidase
MRSDVIFWDVDTQVDFMHADGKLYVPGSEEISPVLARLTDYAHRHGIRIIASADDHVAGHRELSDTPDWQETFPEHCLRGRRAGEDRRDRARHRCDRVELEPGMLAARVRTHEGDLLFHKHWFDVFTNPNVLPVLDALAPARIVLYGVALDVCDKYAIDGLLRHRPGLRLALVTDAVRAIHPEAGAALLQHWAGRGVALVTSTEVLAA